MPSSSRRSLQADARNFAAYDSCRADQYMASLSPDLEFYQDNQPVKRSTAGD